MLLLPRRLGMLACAVLTLTVLPVPPVMAQEELDELSSLPGQTVSLEEAFSRAMQYRAPVAQAVQSISQRQGQYQEARGLFDGIFFLDSRYGVRQLELLNGTRQQEIRRRIPLEFAIPALTDAADLIIDRLPTSESLLFTECAPDQDLFVVRVDALPGATEVTLCFDGLLQLQRIVPGEGFEDLIEINEVLEVLRSIGGLSEEIARDLQAGFADRLRVLVRSLRFMVDSMILQRDSLGDLPEVEQFLQLRFELGRQWRFYSGVTLTASMLLQSTEDNYRDKPLLPSRGDTVFGNTFAVNAGLSVEIPLGKGRGRVAAAAPVFATEAAIAAERNIYLHTSSAEALSLIDAYWGVAAAQRNLALLVESARTQAQVLQNTRDLIEGDELAGAEISRSEAQYSGALSRVSQARRSLVNERLRLIDAMGISVPTGDDAPLAADELPDPTTVELDPEVWIDRALANRWDLKAAQEATRASDILVDSARANLRHQVDLTLSAQYQGFHESFTDRLYDFKGFEEAATGLISGPSFAIRFRWAIPVKNRAARGRLAQAQASAERSRITETDIGRGIRLDIYALLGRYSATLEEYTHLVATLDSLESTLNASLERFRGSDLTLIDVLTTESQLTDARLQVLDRERQLASLRSQLQFLSGELIGGPVEWDDLDPSDLTLWRDGLVESS